MSGRTRPVALRCVTLVTCSLLALACVEEAGPPADASTDAGMPDAGADLEGPACSPCRAMGPDMCWSDPRCELIPTWVSGPGPCARPDGWCGWRGCRAAGLTDVCPSSQDADACAETHGCGVSYLPTAEDGCRYCVECPDPEVWVDQVAQCAIDALCAEAPDSAECQYWRDM